MADINDFLKAGVKNLDFFEEKDEDYTEGLKAALGNGNVLLMGDLNLHFPLET